jgi:Ca-activated chloride channel family protein
LIGGFAGYLIAGKIYGDQSQNWNPVILVGVYFAILSFCICLPGVVSEWLTNHLKERTWDSRETTTAFFLLPLSTLVLFFLLGAIFQFLYGLGIVKSIDEQADDYIIMIDNSGSTESTDPENQRFTAVVDFVKGLDADEKVMVTIFDIENQIVLPLTNASAAVPQLEQIFSGYSSGGGTDIQTALLDSLDHYSDSSRTAMGILMSDGVSTVGVRQIADSYAEREIRLFTIGFARIGSKGRRVMNRIAQATGGTFYEINEISQLSSALSKVIQYESRRILLDYRPGRDRSNGLFMILRIVFLTILGSVMGVPLIFMLDSEELILPALAVRGAASFVAGILVEWGLYQFHSPNFLRFVMCLLFALVVSFYTIHDQIDLIMGIGDYHGKSQSKFNDSSSTQRTKEGFRNNNAEFGRGDKNRSGLEKKDRSTFRKY